MKRLGALLLACAFAASAGATEVGVKKRELDAVKTQLRELQQQYRETSRQRGDAADALAESERAISETTRVLRELSGKQALTRQQLQTLQTETGAVEARVRARQASLAAALRASHARGEGDALKLLLNGGDPNQSARDLRALARLSEAQARQVAALRADLARLAALRERAAAQNHDLDTLRAQRETEQKKLEADKRKRAVVLAGLSEEIQQQQRAIATLQRDEKALTALVDKLNRILAQRARAAKKPKPARPSSARAQTGKREPERAGGPVGVTTATSEPVDTASAFSHLRGSLRLPVAGELMNRFGAPREGGGVNWKGLFIRAARGQAVKAIAAGEVVFADWMRGFGNLIVVDHGEGYMSLYSNNESLYKRVGERVRAGDTLAAVGNSGGQPDPGLYFEMRYLSRPLNPMTWVK